MGPALYASASGAWRLMFRAERGPGLEHIVFSEAGFTARTPWSDTEPGNAALAWSDQLDFTAHAKSKSRNKSNRTELDNPGVFR